jgi:hypothetical protein
LQRKRHARMSWKHHARFGIAQCQPVHVEQSSHRLDERYGVPLSTISSMLLLVTRLRLILPPRKGNLRFPITNCRTNFDGELSRGSLRGISEPVRTAIELAQPYNRPHEKIPPLLAILRNLNNADKHKLLQLVYASLNTGDVGFVGQNPLGNWQAIPYPGQIKDGAFYPDDR